MTKTNKEVVKSQKLVSKAVGVFTQAIKEVEKANDLLSKGIESDSMAEVGIKNQIADLQNKLTNIESAKQDKGAEIKANTTLIENLKQFI